MKTALTVLCLAATCFSAAAQQLTLVWKTDTVLRVPESVLFDEKQNILYVSNIDGKPAEKDGKGFICKMSADGKILNPNWVGGLDAPKGMGMYKNTLYVADLANVVEIDVFQGRIVKRHKIEGADFLNDITVDNKGNVYISDSGTGKIHVIRNGKAPELYFESSELKRVNGLLALADGSMYVADAGTGTNYKLTRDKKLTKYTETAQGADGVVLTGKNEYIVSSWGGEVYYVDASGKATKLLDTKAEKLNTADIAYDPKKQLVFIPTFFGNTVAAYRFEKSK